MAAAHRCLTFPRMQRKLGRLHTREPWGGTTAWPPGTKPKPEKEATLWSPGPQLWLLDTSVGHPGGRHHHTPRPHHHTPRLGKRWAFNTSCCSRAAPNQPPLPCGAFAAHGRCAEGRHCTVLTSQLLSSLKPEAGQTQRHWQPRGPCFEGRRVFQEALFSVRGSGPAISDFSFTAWSLWKCF